MSDEFRPRSGVAAGHPERAEERDAAARRVLEDAFNRGDFTAADELVAPEAILQ
ncbi:MAG: hypothetical protein M3P39_00045 [Actinomycetota bacterium]|nr:hypothetical protein [Actinomycetota bacterium]